MAITILIRHAQSLLNTDETQEHDADLSKKGNSQLYGLNNYLFEILGSQWKESDFKGYVSPFLRTLKTANSINNINFKVDFRIAEKPDNSYKKLLISNIPKKEKDFPKFDWSLFPEELDCINRTLEGYHKLLEQFIHDLAPNSIIVSHLSPILDLANKLLICDKDKEYINHKLITNCSITVIQNGKLIKLSKDEYVATKFV